MISHTLFLLSIIKGKNKFSIYLLLSNKKRITLDDENLFKKKKVNRNNCDYYTYNQNYRNNFINDGSIYRHNYLLLY